MKVSYKRELDHNYLVLEEEEYQENYQAGMLLKNRIPGFLECRMSRFDEGASFYYEITSRQSLRLVLERKRLNQEELLKLLNGMYQAVQSCAEYLLDVDRLLLDPDYIYLDPDEWTMYFCFFPCGRQDFGKNAGYSLLELAEYLLDRLDRQDSGAVTLGYEFYRIAGEENPSLGKLLEDWQETEEKDGAADAAYAGEPQTLAPPDKKIIHYDGRGQACLEEDCIREREPQRNFDAASPEWTEGKDGGTSFLSKIREPGLFLRSESASCPDLRVTKDSFLIGKKKDAVDGWLKVRGISRIHSRISREEDCYYLTDLNSTNGTYLNGGRLEVNEKARLRPGDTVGFADVRYIVEG